MNAHLLISRRLPLCCALAFAASIAQAQDSTSIPELKALDHYLGEWDAQMNVNAGDPSKPPQIVTGTVRAARILDGRFVQQFVTFNDPAGNASTSITTLMTFDVAGKTYRSWSFTSSGSLTVGTGSWDEKSKTMTTVVRDPKAGTETTVRADFSAKDVESWSFTTKNREGKVISVLKGKNTKR